MRLFLQLLFVMLTTAAWASEADTLATVRYDFNEPLGSEWEYVHEPVRENYVTHDGMLRLYGSITSLGEGHQPTFTAVRPAMLNPLSAEKADTANYTLTMKIAHTDLLNSDEVGLAVYQAPTGYVQCCIYNLRGDRRVRLRLKLKSISVTLSDRSLGVPQTLWIRMDARDDMYNFSYSTNGQRFTALEPVDRSLLRPVVVGQGDGIMVGPYAFMRSPKLQTGRSFGDIDEMEIKFHK